MIKMIIRYYVLILIFTLPAAAIAKTIATDPLPSWNNGAIKQNIIQFVQTVTDPHNKFYVEPEKRIATIDNDGTLWVEQPIYTQAIFAIERIKILAPQHPEWKNQAPFQAILSGDKKAISQLSEQDLGHVLAVTHSGMTVETFQKIVSAWLATAKNPRYQRHYTELVYQPMLEVMNYLRKNNFKIYIVSGGGQEFMRAFAPAVYHVPLNAIIGTAGVTHYTDQNGQPVLIKMPKVLFIDDKTGKPEAINLFIGMKPIIAFGNSVGDQQMLEWTQSGNGARMMLLVHHDDAKREYAYGPDSKVGTFSQALMTEAKQRNWNVISMQKDWKVIFPFEQHYQ
jgi:phosphoserine phosphatase